jgi:RsiW-degrading membrane proteinase PrsW (M82 family)
VSVDFALHALVGLLPVLCFLGALVYLDSYKLVRVRWILFTIAIGGVIAGSSYFIHTSLLDATEMEYAQYVRYISPPIEEALKGLIIVGLLRLNRIGFLVDAAIFGFAAGAGFSMIENLYFLQLLEESHIGVWIVRGFGTAIMHGGATAILAVSYRALIRQENRSYIVAFLPGLLVAAIIHSLFNHFFFSPINNALTVLIVLPAMLTVVYRQSERAVANWLDVGFDADTELLELINSGQFSTSKVGLYLMTLKEKFRGEIVADLLCYLRLHVELAIRAKGLLMMRESGFANEVGEETRAKLEEMKFLEGSIGATGKLALKPFLQMSRKDLWQIYMLSN